jgi:hypothetical protein
MPVCDEKTRRGYERVTIEGRQNDGEMKERRSTEKPMRDDERGMRAEYGERVTRE